jgi:CBS domain-containing protein
MNTNDLQQSVRTLMSSPVQTVDYAEPVADAAKTLCRNDIGSLVVEDDGIVGIITEADFMRAVGAEREFDRATVGQLMSESVETIEATEPIETACDRMHSNDSKRLVVTDDGALAGIVTTTDITHWLAPSLEEVIQTFQ